MVIRKIPAKRLKPGMFVDHFDRNWLETPFFCKSVMISSESMVVKILEMGIHEVFIDTSKGADFQEAPTMEEAQAESEKIIKRIAAAPMAPASATFVEEIKRAFPIMHEADNLITSAMKGIKSGRMADPDSFKPLVNDIVESIFSNPHALMCLTRIRRRDSYTFQHSIAVCTVATAFCRHLGVPKETVTQVAIGGLLHDMGKMLVPDSVLNKPGKLTPDELEVMKSHVLLAKRAIKNFAGLSTASENIIMQHHENYDGSGYPRGLKGEEISKPGLMGAIVDAYDALTADRCYHNRLSPTEALRKIYEWGKHRFKMEMVEQFIKFVGIYPSGTIVTLQSGFVGVVLEPSTKGALRPKVRVVFDANKKSEVEPFDADLSDEHGLIYGEITRVEKPGAWGIDAAGHLLNWSGVSPTGV